MADRLKNIVRFTGLAVGVPEAQLHNLNIDGVALRPDYYTKLCRVWPKESGCRLLK